MTRPILFVEYSVTQRLPSEPEAMKWGVELARSRGNSVTAPAVVMRPTLLAWLSVNQRAPSGPTAMP